MDVSLLWSKGRANIVMGLDSLYPMPSDWKNARDAVARELLRERKKSVRVQKSLERLLLEFDFLVGGCHIVDIRNDVIFEEARAALEDSHKRD